jgi:hypothetical protein
MIKSIIIYFQILRDEIIKALPNKKEVKTMTISEAMKYYSNFSKNQLVDMLAHVIADKERLIPKFRDRRSQKQFSKTQLIKYLLQLTKEGKQNG